MPSAQSNWRVPSDWRDTSKLETSGGGAKNRLDANICTQSPTALPTPRTRT